MTPRRMMALPRDDEFNNDAHQGSRWRPPRATKAARCTGVDEAVFASTMNDAKDNDVAPHDEDSDNGTIDDADDDAEKGAKPRALTSTAQGTYAPRPPPTTATTTPTTPPTRSKKPRATDKANEATRDCTRRVRVAVARNSAMAT